MAAIVRAFAERSLSSPLASRMVKHVIIPTGLCVDLIDGMDEPGIAGECGEAPGFVT